MPVATMTARLDVSHGEKRRHTASNDSSLRCQPSARSRIMAAAPTTTPAVSRCVACSSRMNQNVDWIATLGAVPDSHSASARTRADPNTCEEQPERRQRGRAWPEHPGYVYGARVATVPGSLIVIIAGFAAAAPVAAQREFREFPSFEGEVAAAALPPDYKVPGELVIGRLMYPDSRFGYGNEWKRGGTGWTDDYPRGDRTFVQMLRRFTRTDVRAVEQPVDLDDGDDAHYWPFLVAGLAGSWNLTDEQ